VKPKFECLTTLHRQLSRRLEVSLFARYVGVNVCIPSETLQGALDVLILGPWLAARNTATHYLRYPGRTQTLRLRVSVRCPIFDESYYPADRDR